MIKHGHRFKDITGKRFGRLVAVRWWGHMGSNKRANGWECLCDCGSLHIARYTDLSQGKVASCGCSKNGVSPPNTVNLVGTRFARLVVLHRDGSTSHQKSRWSCRCDCGNIVKAGADGLRSGNVKSCGCLRRETLERNWKEQGDKLRTHGKSKTAEYRAWYGMNKRCYNPRDKAYWYYGGRLDRPVCVCDQWRGTDGFLTFLSDMGLKPTPEHSLDRFPDCWGNYEPGNCRWATAIEQNQNRRALGPHVGIDGKTLTIYDCAVLCGLQTKTLRDLWKRGWDIKEVVLKSLAKDRGEKAS